MSCKEMMQRGIHSICGITRKDVRSFLGDNWPFLLRVGLYTIPAIFPATSAFAAGSVGIEPLEKPLTTIHDALTGPIPILVTAGAVAMGGMSWAMGWEQQVMMRCVKGAGGGAIAIGAGKFMESVLGEGDSGCLF